MTPTLVGRIQTRLALLAVPGAIWTLLIGLVLPRGDASLGTQYRTLFTALFVVAAIGVVWELVYHGAQQFRWEKDWPTVFGLLTAIPEGVVVWLVLRAGLPWDVRPVSGVSFAVMFVTVWLLVWALANGPMKVVFIRWRYRGGRLDVPW